MIVEIGHTCHILRIPHICYGISTFFFPLHYSFCKSFRSKEKKVKVVSGFHNIFAIIVAVAVPFFPPTFWNWCVPRYVQMNEIENKWINNWKFLFFAFCALVLVDMIERTNRLISIQNVKISLSFSSFFFL